MHATGWKTGVWLLLFLTLLFLTLTACGNKGPLVMPDAGEGNGVNSTDGDNDGNNTEKNTELLQQGLTS